VVRRFLDRAGSFECVQDPRIRSGTADATAALDRALREAA
jgi:hypothetical protein